MNVTIEQLFQFLGEAYVKLRLLETEIDLLRVQITELTEDSDE